MSGPGSAAGLPLEGIRVVEFTHMVMGPAVGAILVELGAEVSKVEPVGGDATRKLLGSGVMCLVIVLLASETGSSTPPGSLRSVPTQNVMVSDGFPSTQTLPT